MAMLDTKVSNQSMKIAPVGASAFAVLMLMGAFSLPTAFAAVTFDPTTGTGFVGKGDVQTALNLNNRELQQQADSLKFTSATTTVTEVSWVCTNDRNENIQERARTTTTETTGVVSSEARERNQITGFNLMGFAGTPTTTSSTEGPALNTCPSGPWTLTTPAGDPETISQTSTLFVNGVEL
jgi:hypothetical protein